LLLGVGVGLAKRVCSPWLSVVAGPDEEEVLGAPVGAAANTSCTRPPREDEPVSMWK